jgi:uncharacterized integral membrane protein
MRFRSVVAIVVSILAALFFVLNWRVFAAPATITLVLTSVEAPIGIVMLVLFALGVLVLSSYVGVWQGTLLKEFRRQTKELQAQRSLAESAEGSRFTELGALIRDELAKSDQRTATALEALRVELHDTEHSIAATLAEMDDRLRRGADRPP